MELKIQNQHEPYIIKLKSRRQREKIRQDIGLLDFNLSMGNYKIKFIQITKILHSLHIYFIISMFKVTNFLHSDWTCYFTAYDIISL